MPYSPTNWVSGNTAVSAPNMNNIESGIGNCVYKDGSVSMTGTLAASQALSGSNKVFLDLAASDGKRWQLIIRTDGKIVFYNVTDAVTLLEIGPTSGVTTNGVALAQMAGGGNKVSVQSSAPGSPATGDVWIDTSVNLG